MRLLKRARIQSPNSSFTFRNIVVMNRHHYPTLRACLRALVLLAVCASAASAQIGGPQDTKPKPAGADAAQAKAPAAAAGTFEKEGVRIAFTAKANEQSGAG